MPPKAARKQSEAATSQSEAATKSRRSSAYDPNFGMYLSQYRIHPVFAGAEPDNLDEIRRRLAQPRRSLSPSSFPDSAFRDFQTKDEEAALEVRSSSNSFLSHGRNR